MVRIHFEESLSLASEQLRSKKTHQFIRNTQYTFCVLNLTKKYNQVALLAFQRMLFGPCTNLRVMSLQTILAVSMNIQHTLYPSALM